MSNTPAAPTPAACEPVTVPLRQVERELDRQLKCIQEGAGEAPVFRAGLSNLVIYCDSAARAAEVEADVPAIVSLHPARVLLLVHEPSEEPGPVTATVHTRMQAMGHGLRAFSEQVTLRADGRAVEHLPYAVRALLIGDLPINLWWAAPQPPAGAGALLYDLSENADQVIYDSYGWPEPARGMAATATWIEKFERGPGQGRHRVASDLTWRRLKGWRRVLAEALAPAVAPGAIESATEVTVDHGPHSVMAAWSLASWIALELGWTVASASVRPGIDIDWRFRSPHGPKRMTIRRIADAPRGVRKVHLRCHIEGAADALHVVPEDDDRRLSVDLENDDLAPRTVSVPPQPIAELVARQLSDRERDLVFRRAMTVAQTLATSVLGG